MKIKNQQKDAIESTITLREFANAMRQQDLSSVPPEKRTKAILDHFFTVMGDSVTDPQQKHEIRLSQALRRKLGHRLG